MCIVKVIPIVILSVFHFKGLNRLFWLTKGKEAVLLKSRVESAKSLGQHNVEKIHEIG